MNTDYGIIARAAAQQLHRASFDERDGFPSLETLFKETLLRFQTEEDKNHPDCKKISRLYDKAADLADRIGYKHRLQASHAEIGRLEDEFNACVQTLEAF